MPHYIFLPSLRKMCSEGETFELPTPFTTAWRTKGSLCEVLGWAVKNGHLLLIEVCFRIMLLSRLSPYSQCYFGFKTKSQQWHFTLQLHFVRFSQSCNYNIFAMSQAQRGKLFGTFHYFSCLIEIWTKIDMSVTLTGALFPIAPKNCLLSL